MVVGGLGEGVAHVVTRILDGQGAQHAPREGATRAIETRAALCVCEDVSTRCTPMRGSRRSRRGCGPSVKKRVIDDQGAQHALREGEMRTIDARVALGVR